MPQFSPQVLSTTVPVPATKVAFEPVVIDGPLAIYAGEIRPGGTAPVGGTPTVLEPSMVISLRKPSKTSRVSKCQVTLIVPVPALDIDGKTPLKTKDREARLDLVLTTSERALPNERQQVIDLLQSIFSDEKLMQTLVFNKTIY
jgi:hypothetical protein